MKFLHITRENILSKPYDLNSEIPLPGLESYYNEFLANRINELGEIRQALKVKNFRIASDYAHKWKGFAAPYGFGVLGQLAQDIEKCLERAEIDHCEILIDEAEVYLTNKKKKG